MTTQSALQAAIAAAAQAAQVSAVDMTETSKGGGGERRVLETGQYMARFCEYIEKGTQKNPWEASKPPRPVAELRFAVFPIDEVDGVRTVSKEPVFLTTYDQTISNHEKATMKGIYNKMNYRNDATKTHIAMFLGQAFMIGVVKYENKAKKSANKIDLKAITPAIDPISGAPYPVPELDDKAYRVFFWDMPTKETWDALYIEGTYEDGDRKGESKNFVQEGILKAVDFPGSALEQMLGGSPSIPTGMLETAESEQALPDAPAAPVAAPAAPNLPPMPSAPVAPDTVPWEAPVDVTADVPQ